MNGDNLWSDVLKNKKAKQRRDMVRGPDGGLHSKVNKRQVRFNTDQHGGERTSID